MYTLSNHPQVADKNQRRSKDEASRKEAFKAGRTHGISGREMFTFNPNMVQDDDDDDGVVTMTTIDSDDEEVST